MKNPNKKKEEIHVRRDELFRRKNDLNNMREVVETQRGLAIEALRCLQDADFSLTGTLYDPALVHQHEIAELDRLLGLIDDLYDKNDATITAVNEAA